MFLTSNSNFSLLVYRKSIDFYLLTLYIASLYIYIYIYVIYIYIIDIYIIHIHYTYIYVCMCVCVCVCTLYIYIIIHTWLSSVTQSCLTFCYPMDCSTPGLPVHHQLQEFTQTHVHWVGDAIQPPHHLSSLSPPAFSLSQYQGLLQYI